MVPDRVLPPSVQAQKSLGFHGCTVGFTLLLSVRQRKVFCRQFRVTAVWGAPVLRFPQGVSGHPHNY